MNSHLISNRHGNFFSDPFEDYCGEEDAFGGQSMLKHKAAELLLEEENYKGLKRDRGMIERNHYKAKAQAWEIRQLPSCAYFHKGLYLNVTWNYEHSQNDKTRD